jgi:hypothetical protein
VAARQRIPQRHVDRRERHPDESLRPKEAKAPRELLLDLRRRQRIADEERRDVADELGDGFNAAGV